jgi:septum formation protein
LRRRKKSKRRKKKMRVILASASPSRKELLKLVIPKFEVRISKVDEVMQEGLTPEEQVERLAYIKAKSVYDETKGNRIVIGADTMVVKQGKIYGKPKNREHAKEMIKELLEGDKTHEIVTGLSVIIENDEKAKVYKLQDKVKVYLKDMS